MANLPCLIHIFTRLRDLVALDDNDFSWSSWRDQQQAIQEIDHEIADARKGRTPNGWIFAPTGPAHELSLSSGWSDEFSSLADTYDKALCNCQSSLELTRGLGMDASFAEVTVLRCTTCGQFWLKWFYENEAESGSGRWSLGAITAEQAASVSAPDATALLDDLPGTLCGGSYYGGTCTWVLR